jgi:acetoin utilization protein AcuB
MFVSKSMTKKVITIDKEASIFDAQKKMVENNIRHLPVVENENQLIGVVTDRDIRSALPYTLFKEPQNLEEREKIANILIKDIMTTKLITITPLDTIQDALLQIQRAKVGALPVVDEQGRLKGIISVRDLLRAFINVLGIGQPGTLVGILVEEKVGQLKKIIDAITEMNISFGSVLVARYWGKNQRAVFPYLLTNNVAPIKRKLQQMGYTLLDPMDWIVDELPKDD